MIKSGMERRNFPRAKRVLSIEYRLINPKRRGIDNTWHLSTTEDMSLGGIGFYSEYEFRAADVLEVRVVMSGVLDIFKGFVKVIRVDRKKTGSYFFVAAKFLQKAARPAKSYSSRSNRLKKVSV